MKQRSRQGESGNVLFLILIAVVLFAALSYAVTQSSRSGAGSAANETNSLNAAQVTQYPASVRTAVVRMMVNGVDSSQLEFDPPADFVASSETFGVFHPAAGGATYVTAPPDVITTGAQTPWLFNSRYQVEDIGTTVATNAGNDIIAFLVGVNATVCQRINTELGITSPGTDADSDGVQDAGVLIANIPTLAMNQDDGASGIGAYAGTFVIGGDFAGQPFGCADFDATADDDDDADLVYYHVLVER